MTNNQFKTLGEIIIEALKIRNLNTGKLSELTDIPLNYLIALSDDDLIELPSAPYIRGYLVKIADVLKIDTNLLLRAYKQEISLQSLKTSGSSDKLPSNRYALNILTKKIVIVSGIILVLIIFCLIWQASGFLGVPKIEITNPPVDGAIINNQTIRLSGEVSAGDKLVINGEEVLPEENGRFEKDFSLQIGINTFELKVKRFLGKEIKIIRQVIYQPQISN
ncbi:MAG: helix-turn-helix domain-containing protein [bacterium]|nr:helix-turn-helix domain-containing protein [bacterium]